MTRRAAWVALALLVAAPARADEAEQMVGLFAQGCVPFAGNAAGLRAWVARLGLKPLPPGGQAAFLQGQPGIAFDATNAEGKFVLVSADGGGCAVVAERATGDRLAAGLEAVLTRSGIGFTATDRGDPEEKGIRYRDYRASKGTLVWRIVLGTGDSGAHPMLSAIRE